MPMKREFHAHFPLALKDSVTQGFAISWLVHIKDRLPSQWQEISQIHDDWARIEILSQAIVTERKDEARVGTRKSSSGLRYWIENHSTKFLTHQIKTMKALQLIPSLPDESQFKTLFPSGSFFLRIPFTLRKPYISRDDKEFYILDNPVKKEWVFKVPYVAPSQWKGALRAAMVKQLVDWWTSLDTSQQDPKAFASYRFRLFFLFGSEKGEEPDSIKGLAEYLDRIGGADAAEEFRNKIRGCFGIEPDKPIPHFRGALHFYPTFFNRIGLEVINPHNRKTGAGTQPIYFECVPIGTRGVFSLLYVPLYQQNMDTEQNGGPDTSDQGNQDATASTQPDSHHSIVERDLQLLAHGIKAMLTQYGFGAKTSSGFGAADVELDRIQVAPETYRDIFINERERDE